MGVRDPGLRPHVREEVCPGGTPVKSRRTSRAGSPAGEDRVEEEEVTLLHFHVEPGRRVLVPEVSTFGVSPCPRSGSLLT